MSAATVSRYTPAPADAARKRRHRLWIMLGAAAGIVAAIALCVNGLSYYILSADARFASPQHAALKPSGTIGNALGIVGGVLLGLMYLYPLRKKWKWLSKKGKTKNWLDYHILMGFVGPVLITFHSSFKLRGVAGFAYWSMIAVVASGIVGRYLYNRIPRKLDAVEMSVDEAGELCANLARQIRAQNVLTEEELEPLLALPSLDEVRAMPLGKALVVIVALDVRRAWTIWRLRWKLGAHVAGHADVRGALAAIRKQAALSKDALFLGKVRQMFRLWHVIHRPFSYSLAIMATLHILAVVFLGYF
jgi:TRAP-type C4-dicarboxylate transport system permease small subunit